MASVEQKAGAPSPSARADLSVRVSFMATGQQSTVTINGMSAEIAKIKDLRKGIATTLRVPVNQQRLLWRGQELIDDEATLASCGIGQNDVVQLALRPGHVAVARPAMASQPVFYVHEPERPIPPLPQSLAERFLDMAARARIVKILAIIDLIFMLFYALQAWPFLLAIVACMCGYYGATNYKPSLLFVYLIYVLGVAGFRIWYYITYQNDFRSKDGMLVLTILTVALELWVASLIFRLLVLICGFTREELHHMSEVFVPSYGFWQPPTIVRVQDSGAQQGRYNQNQLYQGQQAVYVYEPNSPYSPQWQQSSQQLGQGYPAQQYQYQFQPASSTTQQGPQQQANTTGQLHDIPLSPVVQRPSQQAQANSNANSNASTSTQAVPATGGFSGPSYKMGDDNV